MERKRVIIVGPLPPPVGGVETVTQAVLESDAFRNFDIRHVDLTKARAGRNAGRFDLENIRWALVHFRRLRQAVRDFKPCLVYMPLSATWSGFLRDAVLAWIAKKNRAKVLGHVHGAWFDRILNKRGLNGVIVRKSLRRFDGLLMLGTRWMEAVNSYGYKGQVFIVPSTLRRELFERGMQFNRDYREHHPIGLFVGQIGKRKGVFDLLDALRLLKESGKPVKVLFVGPEEFVGEWDAVMRARAESGVEDVAEFTGSLQGEALNERFEKSDFFILPSYSEGLPVVLFEAGAFGLPVIATPVGAIPDLLEHGRNALLVEPGDRQGIADAIDKLRADPIERQKLGTQLRNDVRAFQPDVVCAKIADAICALLECKDFKRDSFAQ